MLFRSIRYQPRKGGGHVCFVYGSVGKKIIILGGNQTDKISFELRSFHGKGVRYFIPISYKEYGTEKEGCVLPDVDIEALRSEFGTAVEISDAILKGIKIDAPNKMS